MPFDPPLGFGDAVNRTIVEEAFVGMAATSERYSLLRFSLVLVTILLTLTFIAIAQDKDNDRAKDKDRDHAKTASGEKMVEVEGSAHCSKPETNYSIDVPDRAGHALQLAKRQCSWTKPLQILGAKTKDGVAVNFTEKMEGTLHMHGFEVDTLDDGEKLTMRTMEQVLAENGPATFRGRWTYMRGTGKYKGIKGGGTYEGKLAADGSWTMDFEGNYVPSAMTVGKQ